MGDNISKIVRELEKIHINVNQYNIDPDYVCYIDETMKGKMKAIKLYLKRYNLNSMVKEIDDIEFTTGNSINILELIKSSIIPDLKILSIKPQGPKDDNQRYENNLSFEYLIHPIVRKVAYRHFITENYREAVLNSVIALFDLIRERTGLNMDGTRLVESALSLNDPYLILSNIDTDSGKNDQKGFMQIICGTYLGVRNPKAHSLIHDLNKKKAAEYLVFIGLLIRRIEESKTVKKSSA